MVKTIKALRVLHITACYSLQQVKWSHSSTPPLQQQLFFSFLRIVLFKIENQVLCALFQTCYMVLTGVIIAETLLGVSKEPNEAVYQVL